MLSSNDGHRQADVNIEHWRKKNIGEANWNVGRCTVGWVQPREVYQDWNKCGGEDEAWTCWVPINPHVITHHLNVSLSYKPVRQKKRVFAPERDNAIKEEVHELVTAEFICEVYYPNWQANVVIIKKADNKWRMCMDFTNLNKAYPKDSYPLPRIDQLVDSTARHQLLTFVDVFSRYNQIKMDEANQKKTSFVTSQSLFCYKVMPFGLKNAGATYQ